jgi:hypothetical protein
MRFSSQKVYGSLIEYFLVPPVRGKQCAHNVWDLRLVLCRYGER